MISGKIFHGAIDHPPNNEISVLAMQILRFCTKPSIYCDIDKIIYITFVYYAFYVFEIIDSKHWISKYQ